MRLPSIGLIAVLVSAAVLPTAALAQSTGYVTGFPGKDPAGDDEIGWGPAYRPETSFSQPGTPPTPGDFAGAAYRARTGRGPYDAVQGPRLNRSSGVRGARFAPDAEASPPRRRHSARHHKRTRQYRR